MAPLRKLPKPQVYDYRDYRAFLRHTFEYFKKVDRRFTVKDFCARAGISQSLMPLILSGQRRLTDPTIEKMAPHLKMSKAAVSFLKTLAQVNDGASGEVKVDAFDRLQRRYAKFGKLNPRETEIFRYLSRWYRVIIREMATLPDFRAEVDWILEKLEVSVPRSKIEKTLEFLIARGFIARRPDGRWHVSAGKEIRCESDVLKLALMEFHRHMLSHAVEAIETVPSEERLLLGWTIGVNAESLADARKILVEAIEKVSEVTRKQSERRQIYHFTVAAVPATKKSE